MLGGHLRYQLYIWLEREVEALRRLCGYVSAAGSASGGELICAEGEPTPLPEKPTLHQLLIREKADFEAKVQRAVRRKKWLKGLYDFFKGLYLIIYLKKRILFKYIHIFKLLLTNHIA